jgi:hypothetical protein
MAKSVPKIHGGGKMKKIIAVLVVIWVVSCCSMLNVSESGAAIDDGRRIDTEIARSVANQACVNLALFSQESVRAHFKEIFSSKEQMTAWANKILEVSKNYNKNGIFEMNSVWALVPSSFQDNLVQFVTPIGVSLIFFESGEQDCEMPNVSVSKNFRQAPLGDQRLKAGKW